MHLGNYCPENRRVVVFQCMYGHFFFLWNSLATGGDSDSMPPNPPPAETRQAPSARRVSPPNNIMTRMRSYSGSYGSLWFHTKFGRIQRRIQNRLSGSGMRSNLCQTSSRAHSTGCRSTHTAHHSPLFALKPIQAFSATHSSSLATFLRQTSSRAHNLGT